MLIKRFKTKGLAFQLSLSILTGATLLIFIILYYNYHFSKKLLIEGVEETAEQLTISTVGRIQTVLTTVQKAPEGMAIYLQYPDLRKETLEGMLSVALKNKPEIYGCCVAFEPFAFMPGVEKYAPYCFRDGDDFSFKNLGDDNYNYLEWAWYILPKEKGQPVWTEPYFDKGGSNVLMTTYSVPFYSSDSTGKTFRGVVTSDVSLNWLEDLMNSIRIFNSGYAFLVSAQGTIITHPVKENQFKNLGDLVQNLGDTTMLKATKQFITGREDGYMPFKSLVNQKPSMLFFSTVPQTNWRMAVVIPEEELFSGLQKLFLYTMFIGISGVILLALVVILFSAQITKPLRRLTLTANEIGAGNFNVEIHEGQSTKEISMLGNALGRMQSELKAYIQNLEITTTAKERIESELQIAHDIQQGMIPKIFPPFPERQDIDIYALLVPARQVGGDLYDFFFLDDETLCFAIGDVSDKGVPASLMMAITITLYRAKSGLGKEISELVNSINRDISKDNANFMFITFFTGILNLRTGELQYCNAGHNYPLLLRKDGSLETLAETHGIPLGINIDQKYKSGTVVLEKNETLVLFTDGITEAISVNGNFYSDERLENLVRNRCKGLDPRQMTEIIMEDVSEFAKTPERSDDITLLVLSYFPPVKN